MYYRTIDPPPRGMGHQQQEEAMINVTEKALKAISEAVKDKTDGIRILVKGYG